MREVPGCVGYHQCGAYLRNEIRKRALRDTKDKPDEAAIEAISTANRAMDEWVGAAQRE